MKTILIVGATSSIAQACIKQWCMLERKLSFILIARSQEKLQYFGQDLLIRYPYISIQQQYIDLKEIEQADKLLKNIFQEQKIDVALIAQGIMYSNENNLNYMEINELIHLNCTSIVVWLDVIYKNMVLQKFGKIGVISSVAGDRGRKANYLYGASKALVSTYVEGLQHKTTLLNQNIQVSLIKPGPTASAMTQHLVEQGKKLANVDEVAKTIVSRMERNQRIIYTPKLWFLIMLIIKNMPFFIFKRIDI